MKICPVSREWIHAHLLAPYLQGVELINLAWKGVDRSLAPNPLSLSERVICWLQGIALMLPLVNTIIWLAWQAFGEPEPLFDRFCPEIEPLPPPPPQVIVHAGLQPAAPVLPVAVAADLVKPTELFGFTETTDALVLQIQWKIEHFQDMIVAQQNCGRFSSTSLYRPNLTLREYHYQTFATDQRRANKVDLLQRGDERSPLDLTITEEGSPPIQKTFELPENLPLIQQRTIGFRPFVQSNERVLDFYAVIPEIPILGYIPFIEKPPFLAKVRATKVGEEEVPGHGRLLKIELVSTWRWPYNAVKSELYFDATGLLKKFVDSGAFIPRKVGEFVQNNPLPV